MDKLIEKFFNLFGVDLENSISKREATACAEITKEIAINFAEWIIENAEFHSAEEWKLFNGGGIKTTSELFNLFLEQNSPC